MGTEVGETLGQVDAQVAMVVDCGDGLCSGSEIPPLAVVGQENGARVSAEGEEEGKFLDESCISKVEIAVETEVVETEIVTEKVVMENDVVLVEEANHIVEVSVETELVETVISTEKLVGNAVGEIKDSKQERNDVENGGGIEEGKCFVSGDTEVLTEADSDNKAELEQDVISLVVDFHGLPDRVIDSGKDGDDGSIAENGEDKEEKVTGSQGSMGDHGDMAGEGGSTQKDTDNGEDGKDCRQGGSEDGESTLNDNHKGEESKDLGKDDDTEDGKSDEKHNGEEGEDLRKDDDSEDEEDDENDENHDYCVGDFVWGKIRSHPWWPGRIYDPSDASEYAKRHSKPKALLVAYFGDGSFSWCHPSQLKPFADGFDETSKQSNSKNFVYAIKAALDEVRFVAELKMVCSCVPEIDRNGLAKPAVLNAGIKPGVLVSDCDLTRLTGHEYGPADVISALKNVAEASRLTNMLEFSVLKGWLSAFCRAKGGCKLAVYHEPMSIEGLEDKNRDGATNLTDISAQLEVQFQGPSEEDWLSSPLRDGSGQSVLKRCTIAEDKLYHRRKKSVADLMNEEVVADPKTQKGKAHGDLTGSERSRSESGKRKLKTSDVGVQSQDGHATISPSARKRVRKKADTLETSKSREKTVVRNENAGNELSSPPGKKRVRKIAEVLETPKSKENGVSSTVNGSSDSEEETKRGKGSSFEDDKEDVKEESKAASGSRKRKKSKYLSPPFTDAISVPRKTSSKKRDEEISEKIRKAARMGERMTKAAGKLIGSTPIAMSGDETHENQLGTPVDSSAHPTSHQPEENHESVKNKSVKEVVTEVRAVARNPYFALDSLDGKFIQAFRSSVYSNGSNYKKPLEDEDGEQGEKGKSSNSKSGLPEADSQHIRNEKNEENKSQKSELELLETDVNQSEPVLVEPETPKASNDINELAKSRKKRTSRAGEVSTDEKSREVEPGRKRRRSSNSKPEVVDNKNENAKSGKRKAKQHGEASKTKKSSEDMSGEGSLPPPPALILSFPPAFVLPTKDDIIRIFRKYGRLNEKETNVLYNSFCARIVFLKASDAEEACKTSAEEKHFGAAKVSYRLQYPPGATNAAAQKAPPPKTATPVTVKPPAASQGSSSAAATAAAAAEVTPLAVFVKEKVELMRSMLANSEGSISPELKATLEGEMGGLLEKVSAAINSTSS